MNRTIGEQSMNSESSFFDRFSTVIGHPVRAQLQDGTSTDGVLYCIDPETDHLALLCPSSNEASGYDVKIVLAHHVRGIEERPQESVRLPTLAELRQERRKESSNERRRGDVASVHHRRELLTQCLAKNFIPFEVDAGGNISVFGGAATISAPFRTVQCANEQLLRRLQQLLSQLDKQ
ncbi:hypothetical protein P3T76_012375 [Phytophthora citrophthora]|uniref:Gem-associated protein 6 n=1 Tax=Phytophthora citrophthora TaxID=4793 RepID=A0AAD9G5T9_9STRA|nr:hypothetical protein P3T76_012375 [Phytophthora citrophthora]